MALERIPSGDSDHLGHAVDPELGKPRDAFHHELPLAVWPERGWTVCLSGQLRADLLRQAQAGEPVQVQRQVPVRESVRRFLVQKSEHRQLPAVVLYHCAAVDRRRDRDAVGLCQQLGGLVAVDNALGLADGCDPFGSCCA